MLRLRQTIVALEKQYILNIKSVFFEASGILHAMRMHPIVMCGLPRSTIFFHIISQTVRYFKTIKGIEHKMCVLIFSTNLSEQFLILRRSEPQAAHLLRSWFQIPLGAWIFVCCECRVLSGRGLCDELITRPEESYRLWCVVVCDLETSKIGAPYIYMTLAA